MRKFEHRAVALTNTRWPTSSCSPSSDGWRSPRHRRGHATRSPAARRPRIARCLRQKRRRTSWTRGIFAADVDERPQGNQRRVAGRLEPAALRRRGRLTPARTRGGRRGRLSLRRALAEERVPGVDEAEAKEIVTAGRAQIDGGLLQRVFDGRGAGDAPCCISMAATPATMRAAIDVPS